MDRFSDYETVAASQTDQVLGPSGGEKNVLARMIVLPASTSPGEVSIQDGAGSNIVVFTGGVTSVADLTPVVIELWMKAVTDWRVTTGAAVSVICVGRFT